MNTFGNVQRFFKGDISLPVSFWFIQLTGFILIQVLAQGTIWLSQGSATSLDNPRFLTSVVLAIIGTFWLPVTSVGVFNSATRYNGERHWFWMVTCVQIVIWLLFIYLLVVAAMWAKIF